MSETDRRNPAAPAAADLPLAPREADLTEWVTATTTGGTWAWDKLRTYQLDHDQWRMIHDGAVIHGTDRTAAPDPDFPDRADEDDPDGHGPEGLTDFTVRMWRGGQLRERQIRRMTTSHAREMNMLDKLGTSSYLGADVGKNGRARLFQATCALSEAGNRESDVFYPITGHHEVNGQRVFIGGTRAITATGPHPSLIVATDSRLAAWTFPDPLTGGQMMDDGLAEVIALCEGAEPRVIVPQIATVWRAMFGVYRDPADPAAGDEVSPTAWCSGPTGQGKSGTTAAAVNCGGAPGIRYNTLPFKAGPATNGGISGPALERILFRARDLCIPFDDLDPSIPVATARAWQSDFLRRLADQKSRAVAAGPEGLRDARPPRCLSIASGEPMDGEDSAVNRALNLPFDRGTVRIGELRKLTGPDQRMLRARFGTSVLCAILADLPGARAMLARQREAWRPVFLAGRGEAGPVLRGAGVAAELMATLDVTLTLAVRRGASAWLADRAREEWHRAMLAAWNAHLELIGASSRSRSYIEIIRQALLSGAAYMDDAAAPGSPPPNLEIATGWRPQIQKGGPDIYVPKGSLIGWLDEDGSAWLLPNAATSAARTLADKSGEGFTGTPKTVGETLKADGMLIAHGDGADSQRRAEVELPRILRRAGLGKRAWHVSTDAWDSAESDESGANDLIQGAPTAPTSEITAPTAAPTSKVPLTCTGPTAPTENPVFAPPCSGGNSPLSGGTPADQQFPETAPTAPTENPAGLRDVAPTAPTENPAELRDKDDTRSKAPEPAAREAWFRAARDRSTFRTDPQWAALADAITHLDEPDIDDHPERLRVLAALEGSKQSGHFAPRRRGERPYPYWQAPMPQAAHDIRIHDGWAWERDSYDGPAVALDRGGAWVSATASVDVAHGKLEHTGPVDLDTGPVRPGYYLTAWHPWAERGLPHPLGTAADPGTLTLVTAPDMALIRDLRRAGRWPEIDVADSWTGDPARLADWAHYVRELRRYAIEQHGRDSAAYTAIKAAFGMATSLILGSNADDGTKTWKCKTRRLDWIHHIKRQSAVTLWRSANDCLTAAPQLGPVGLRNNDELVIPSAALEAVTTRPITPLGSNTPRPAVRLDPLGIDLGTFKVKSGEG